MPESLSVDVQRLHCGKFDPGHSMLTMIQLLLQRKCMTRSSSFEGLKWTEVQEEVFRRGEVSNTLSFFAEEHPHPLISV